MAWDSDEIRKEREFGWFREHEKDLIETAKRRRIEAEQARAAAAAAAEWAAQSGRCPKCGTKMQSARIEDVEIDQCPSCEGIFFDRGELESVLMRHDAHKRGFFRKLLGFEKD